MKSLPEDLLEYLAANGMGTIAPDAPLVDEWKLSHGAEPSEPANAITLYSTGGMGPDTNEDDVYRPNFQVRVRSFDKSDGDARQADILALLSRDSLRLSTCYVVAIKATTDMLDLGRDEQERYLSVVNYKAVRQGFIEEYDSEPEAQADLIDDGLEVVAE